METNPLMYIQGALLRMAQEKYAEALRTGDRKNMLTQSRFLFRNYTACGNDILAKKWTEEYIRCWLDRGDDSQDNDYTDTPPKPALTAKKFSEAFGF